MSQTVHVKAKTKIKKSHIWFFRNFDPYAERIMQIQNGLQIRDQRGLFTLEILFMLKNNTFQG